MKNFKLNLKKKLNRKGFTLAELLVVVAILGILVAISVPLFSSRMEAAKKSTDEANVRAAKAAAAAVLMSDEKLSDDNADAGTWYYDAVNGKLVGADEKPSKGYGQSTTAVEGAVEAPKDDKGTARILEVKMTRGARGSAADNDSGIELKWVAPTSGT